MHDAVITVPAYFQDPQRGATEDAAAMAKLNVKQLINEPTAAAVCFGADQTDDGRQHLYGVYDLGGGTFDVSIIQVGGGAAATSAWSAPAATRGWAAETSTTEITKWAWARSAAAQRRPEPGPAPAPDQAGGGSRKRELSAANTAMINLPFLTPQLSVNLTITRANFDGLIEPLLRRSLKCFAEAIESARRPAASRRRTSNRCCWSAARPGSPWSGG